MKFKKLASAVAIFTILAGATAVFVSKNTDIMDRIGTLKQLALDWKAKAEGYEADLQAIREKLDLGKDATVEDIITAIDNKATTETNTEVNKLYNELAGYLGLEAEEGHQFTKAEITQALEELSQVQDENGTLKAKLEKMISDINTANTEEEAQLKALNDAIGEVNGENQGDSLGGGKEPEVIPGGGGTPEQPTEPEQPTNPPASETNTKAEAYAKLTGTARTLADNGYQKGDLLVDSFGDYHLKVTANCVNARTVLGIGADTSGQVPNKYYSGILNINAQQVADLNAWAEL